MPPYRTIPSNEEPDILALHYYDLALHSYRKLEYFSGVASILNEKARVMNNQNNYEKAEILYQEIENIYNTYLLTEKKQIKYAWILYDRGRNLADQCKNIESEKYSLEALKIFRELQCQSGIGWSLYSLSILMLNLEKNSLASDYSTEAYTLFSHLRDRSGMAWSRHILGRVAFRQKNYELAHNCYQENIKIWHESQNWSGIAFALEGFARLAAALDQPERSACLFGAAQFLHEDTQVFLPPADLAEHENSLAALQTQIDEATFTSAWNAGREMAEKSIGSSLPFMLNQQTRCQDNILLTQKLRKFLKP